MKVLDPNSASQSIVIIPRFTDYEGDYNLEIFNEDNRSVTNIVHANLVVNALSLVELELTFAFSCSENQTFKLKLTDKSGLRVLYRDKAFATSQVTQKYKINV